MFEGQPTTETHQHYDADGHLTGTTVVTKPSPFGPRSRALALALAAYEDRLCSVCRNLDTVVPADPSDVGPARVTWPGGRSVTVFQFRCIACGATDVIKRDWAAAHENDKNEPGRAAAGDGRMFIGRPNPKEV